MRIDRDSYKLIAANWAIVILLILLILKSINVLWVSIPICVVLFVYVIFVTWFHRVPDRQKVTGEKAITSVADGKIVEIKKVYEPEYLKRDCMLVSIYMNFFDVHANFWPISGEVSYYKYHPGKYLLAFLPKSSEKNEHSSSAIKNQYGEVFFKQIAGTFARRIVCYSDEETEVVRGEQCGIIKFGSRIDLFLPLDVDIKVKIGDLTRACETIIAEFK